MNDGVIFVKVDHTSFVPSSDRGFVGFFHPFCDAMGGGEKVLFQALKAI